MRSRRTTLLRYVFGVAVSAIFLGLALSRIDTGRAAAAILGAAPLPLLGALVIVLAELSLRAWRWRRLIGGIRQVPYGLVFAYLCIGHFANTVLPARLGDLARAHLAGRAFRIGRLVTLGTIAVERVTDASVILLAVLVLGVATPGVRDLVLTAIALGVAVVGAAGLATLVLHGLHRRGLGELRAVRLIRGVAIRVIAGTVALRSVRGAAAVLGTTVFAFGLGAFAYWQVARAVGLDVAPVEAAIVMGVLALSTAIPAAPGSVGTYEFAGLATLTHLGAPPDAALASVVIIHVLALAPPALAGLVATWVLHVRVSDMASSPVGTVAP